MAATPSASPLHFPISHTHTHTHTHITMQGESYHSDLLAILTQEEEGEYSKCLQNLKPGISINNVNSSLKPCKARIISI